MGGIDTQWGSFPARNSFRAEKPLTFTTSFTKRAKSTTYVTQNFISRVTKFITLFTCAVAIRNLGT
jgi:hypothetical protein